jgi:hypothetical protein
MVVERRHQNHKMPKNKANVPSEVAKDINEVLMSPGQNYGKDT